MNKDPYVILGVSPLSTSEEIDKAYKSLAEKYAPDNFSDENERASAKAKMDEINEAYEYAIKRSNAYNGEYKSSNDVYDEIRVLTNQQRFDEAEALLDTVPETSRTGEWHFLKGCLMTQKGWFLEAEGYFDTACKLEPENQEYKNAYDHLKQSTENYARGYRQSPNSGSHCNVTCCDLLCMECFCEICCEGCCEAASGGC